MPRIVALLIAVGVIMGPAVLLTGTCVAWYPEVEGPRRLVEEVLPPDTVVLSVVQGDCSVEIASNNCQLRYAIAVDPQRGLSAARELRTRLLAGGWTERRYRIDLGSVSGLFLLDPDGADWSLAFRFYTSEFRDCHAYNDPPLCPSYVVVDP